MKTRMCLACVCMNDYKKDQSGSRGDIHWVHQREQVVCSCHGAEDNKSIGSSMVRHLKAVDNVEKL